MPLQDHGRQAYGVTRAPRWGQDVPVTDTFPRQRARTRGFRLGAPRSAVPSPDGRRVVFLRSRGGDDPVTCLWVLDVLANGQTRERCVVDPRDLPIEQDADHPAEELARRERMREVSDGITAFATDRAVAAAAFAVSGVAYLVRLDVPGADPIRIDAPGPVVDPRPDPSGQRVAFVCDRGLYLGGPGLTTTALCTPRGQADAWGLADFIAAEEFDRVRGFWWLPDGTALLVEHYDQTPVPVWWIANPAQPDAEPRAHRYPAAGTANADVSLWRVSADRTRARIIWDQQTFPYLTTVSTSPHGDPVISVLTRDQTRQRVLSVDPAMGTTAVLRERSDPAWVDVWPGVPSLAPSGALLEIVADPETDTYRLIRGGEVMTPPGFQVAGVIDAGPDGALVHGGTDPVQDVPAIVTEDTFTTLAESGLVSARMGGGLLVIARTDLESTATTVEVHRAGTRIATIATLAERAVLKPAVTLLRAEPRDLRTAVLFPTGHVPGSARLPIIMSPYGGPHARRVVAAGIAYGTEQWLADLGYCVVVADGRGSSGRGPAWDRAVHRDLATPVLEDQVAAVEAVAAQYPDDVDLDRVGIRGWSFGGYLAALAVMVRPDVFHAAVAGAPVTEWRLYDTAYTERYLGDPTADSGPYDACSLLTRAPDLRRPLLIIHGMADDNVVVAHTLQLSSALLAAGRPHSVLPLTGVTHMTPQEVVAENLLHAERDFFAAHLT